MHFRRAEHDDSEAWLGGRDEVGCPPHLAFHTPARWSSRAVRRWRRSAGQTKQPIYDPGAQTFAPAGDMIARHGSNPVVMLPAGKLVFQVFHETVPTVVPNE